MDILPFGAGDMGLRLEEARRYCGVLPFMLLRLDVDLRKGGVFWRSPRNDETDGEREGGLGDSAFVFVVVGVL